jgi:hypothetical protein
MLLNLPPSPPILPVMPPAALNDPAMPKLPVALILLASILLVGSIKAQEKPFTVLIQNATIHTEDGVIENGVLGIRGDSIVLVADARTVRIDMNAYEKIIK